MLDGKGAANERVHFLVFSKDSCASRTRRNVPTECLPFDRQKVIGMGSCKLLFPITARNYHLISHEAHLLFAVVPCSLVKRRYAWRNTLRAILIYVLTLVL